jgi:glycosyltransferase involved in cell wall biosynthesis
VCSFSIITINHNNLEGLRRTVASVLNQNYKDYEYIIIDGASYDGSLEFLQQNSSCFRFWTSEPDGGIYHAMNKGLAEVQNDWVLFLNSGDCLYDSNVLSDLAPFTDLDTAILYGSVKTVQCDVENTTYIWNPPPKLNSRHFFMGTPVSHQATFYNFKFYSNWIRFDESLSVVADWKLSLTLFTKGLKYKCLDIMIATCEPANASANRSSYIHEYERVLKKDFPRVYFTQIIRSYIRKILNSIKI